MPENMTGLQRASQWRQFTNYMQVLDFQARRPEVARSRMAAYDAKHRGRVVTPSPRPVNRAARRADRRDEDGVRIRGERGTHTADLGTWAAERKEWRAAVKRVTRDLFRQGFTPLTQGVTA